MRNAEEKMAMTDHTIYEWNAEEKMAMTDHTIYEWNAEGKMARDNREGKDTMRTSKKQVDNQRRYPIQCWYHICT